jgi:hypothetical protein
VIGIRPCHDLAHVRPRPDIAAKLHGVWTSGGEIDNAIWGKVRVSESIITYRTPCPRNSFAFGEVLRLGEGTLSGSGRERPEVSVGDIIGFDLWQVGHELPGAAYGIPGTFYSLLWKEMVCAFRPEQPLPQPLSSWIMTTPDEVLMQRLLFSEPTSIYLPEVKAGSMRTNSNRKTNVKLSAERVLGVGSGRFVNKAFTEPGCRIGDGALFMRGGTVDHQHGPRVKLSFTRWDDVEAVVDAR